MKDKGKMKRNVIGLIILLVIGSPFVPAAYAKWGFFAHEYKYKLEDVLDANKFTEKKGYWEGYRDNKLVGYVFLSKDWTKELLGYSGQHLETLIGMDTKGVITRAKLIAHSEPIVLIGLKEENYHKFMEQYSGKNIMQDFSVGKNISLDAVTGATVTAVVQNAIILRSARKVASLTGLIEAHKGPNRKLNKRSVSLTWEELLTSTAIKNLRITSKELGIEGEDIYLDLYFGMVTAPSIGKNVLGEKFYKETIGGPEAGEISIAVFSRGKGSFKGSGFARGGIFDRFSIEQEERVTVFSETDYRILTDIKAKGAPVVQEGGLFKIRQKDFNPADPFRFNLILPYRIGGKKEFRSFKTEYKVPEMFLEQ
jgi:NosR/NirI family nitrous oxide reductase transcriptional regulator